MSRFGIQGTGRAVSFSLLGLVGTEQVPSALSVQDSSEHLTHCSHLMCVSFGVLGLPAGHRTLLMQE